MRMLREKVACIIDVVQCIIIPEELDFSPFLIHRIPFTHHQFDKTSNFSSYSTNGSKIGGNVAFAVTLGAWARANMRLLEAAMPMASSWKSTELDRLLTLKLTFPPITEALSCSNFALITISKETRISDALIGKEFQLVNIAASLRFLHFRHVLQVLPDRTDNYVLPNGASQSFFVKLKLPEGVSCQQCILQVCILNSKLHHIF